jgi:hypothetical protein
VTSSSATFPAPSLAPQSATGPEYLLVQKNHELFRMALADVTGALTKMYDIGDNAVVDPAGRYLAYEAFGSLSIRQLATGREVANVPGGISAAFADHDMAVVAVAGAHQRGGGECLPPAEIVVVDLRRGLRQPALANPSGVNIVAASLAPGGRGTAAGNSLLASCTAVAGVLDMASGAFHPLTSSESGVVAVGPQLNRIWVGLFPARGQDPSTVVFDAHGDETARLLYATLAAFSPDGRHVAYIETHVGPTGLPVNGRIHLGGPDPAPTDQSVSLAVNRDLVWSSSGTGFALLADGDAAPGFRAYWCAASVLSCRPLPLMADGFPGVTLLRVVPANLAGAA